MTDLADLAVHGGVDLAALLAAVDDEAALAVTAALESSWADKHSCKDRDCWGFRAYPVDFFRRILSAAIGAAPLQPSFFDAGAGIGTKVLMAKRAGCQASGVEHNAHYVTEAKRLGADVTEGDVWDVNYSGFDIAWINGPFRDPHAQLAFEAKVMRELKPGAVLMWGNREGNAPAGWEQLTEVIARDGAWRKPLT